MTTQSVPESCDLHNHPLPIPTTERLAQALEALTDPKLGLLIQRARDGFYDDFQSSLPAPQHALVADLRALGHNDFALRVLNGEFDATMEEGLAWMDTEEAHTAMVELVER